MKKENSTDLNKVSEPSAEAHAFADSSMSEELKHAIQNLIYRLRELGPLQTA
ncbi:hypothetical protein AQUSIP_05110 [Aquicella siphonis]|uniref:Uncharacterized protein n=1 Tax=Aquicella siphonis TaxID=254247 RepID=A0A5E4PFL1_9COXI|nr:hypothetical protein [Aquicella siphonis]VVC75223.1 hypothetical protein AQUSIP_05110 [Aquicella siphonis]